MASLAAQGQRSGKFRHVFGDCAKPAAQYLEVKSPLTSGEGRYVSANNKFFAVSLAKGGGPVLIWPLDKPRRIPNNAPLLSVQKGKAWDHDFHPFIPNMIATASDDCSVAVTSFPADGLTANINDAEVMMTGHGKKVILCQFNPCANSILSSASFDKTVKLWNIENGQNIMTYKDCKDNIYSMEWNYDGSQLAVTSKDKMLRIFDPRLPDEASAVKAFEGTKSSKVFWIPNIGWIGAVGFSKTARRQLKFWDLKDLSKEIFSTDIDQVSSVLMPYYDNDNGLLYMSGKGDGTVAYSEIINDNKKWYPLGAYRNPEPQKGGGWIAKRACKVFKCEVNRFLKLTKDKVIPISFVVPRKSGADVFQDDIFPDTYAGKPALSADQWLEGNNKNPIQQSMDPDKQSNDAGVTVFTKKKTYAELEKENADLKARIVELEKQLGIYQDPADADADADNDNDANADDPAADDPPADDPPADDADQKDD